MATVSTRTAGVSRAPLIAMLAFAVLLLSYVVNAMDRQLFPILVSDVQHEYNFSLADSGLLSTIFTLGMGIAGIPAGYLLTRVRRKTVVCIGIVVFSVTTILTAFSTGFWDMLVYRAVSGLGEALQLTALLAIAAAYFSAHRAAAIGSVNLSFAIGAAVGPALGGRLLSTAGGWRTPLVVFGSLGFVLLVVVLVLVRPWLTEATGTIAVASSTEPTQESARPVATRLVNPNTMLLGLASVMGGLVIYGYLGMYPTFLREDLHYSGTATGGVMSIFGLGALASIAGGWIGDRLSPRLVLSAGFALGVVLALVMFNGPASFGVQATLSFVWGAVISGTVYVNLAGYHVKAVHRSLAGRASGVFVATLYIPAAFSGYLVGWLANRLCWSAAGDLAIGVFALVGALSALALDPSRMAGRPHAPAVGRAASLRRGYSDPR